MKLKWKYIIQRAVKTLLVTIIESRIVYYSCWVQLLLKSMSPKPCKKYYESFDPLPTFALLSSIAMLNFIYGPSSPFSFHISHFTKSEHNFLYVFRTVLVVCTCYLWSSLPPLVSRKSRKCSRKSRISRKSRKLRISRFSWKVFWVFLIFLKWAGVMTIDGTCCRMPQFFECLQWWFYTWHTQQNGASY